MLVPWFVLVGGVLVVMAFASHMVQRLPLSPAIVYLCVGIAVGPLGAGLLRIDPLAQAHLLEVLSEIAVLVTLFAVGLRLRLPRRWAAWRLPVALASVAMAVTIVLIAIVGHLLLGLPWAAAALLGAILAPTDPVLASDVQIHEPGDRDVVRLSITAEGGINDGAAFPAVMLGLGLLGLHPLGELGWRWLAVDVLWAVVAGLLLGWACGLAAGHGMQWLRRRGRRLESEEFLVFGVIALAYGIALLLHAYGFLAVFAAGAGLWQAEARGRHNANPDDDASHPDRLMNFSAQVERLAEVALVLVVGAMLSWARWDWRTLAFGLLLLAVARPLAVLTVARQPAVTRRQRRLIAWFGIRGIGSLYYLAYAAGIGLDPAWSHTLVSAVLVTVALSIVLHGVSATPLMESYRRRRSAVARQAESAADAAPGGLSDAGNGR